MLLETKLNHAMTDARTAPADEKRGLFFGSHGGTVVCPVFQRFASFAADRYQTQFVAFAEDADFAFIARIGERINIQ